MNLFMQLLRDECGFVLSAESVLLGTVGVIGATVGISAVARSVNDELTDVAMAIRSLDQSYRIEGISGCGACVAGSCYEQRPVKESLRELREEVERSKAREQKQLERLEKEQAEASEKQAPRDGDPPPPTSKKPHEGGKKNKKNRDRDEDHEDEDENEHNEKPDQEKRETSV